MDVLHPAAGDLKPINGMWHVYWAGEWVDINETATEEEIQIMETPKNTRTHNIGESDYAKHKIQPWDIWLEYRLNPWDADIVKRVLRKKATDSRKMDYQKIIHICQERIRQIDEGVEL